MTIGNILPNAFANIPEKEKRRILQRMTDITKIRSYKECLVSGTHEGKIVEGHVIQKAVQRRLTNTSDVISIVKRPMIFPEAPNFFVPTPLSHAVTGYFTCEKHEADFNPIEQRAPDFDNPWHNALFAYKGVLFQCWVNKAMKRMWETMADEDPQSALPRYFSDFHDRMEHDITHYKERIEAAIVLGKAGQLTGDSSDPLLHAVFYVPTEQAIIAASEWERGNRQNGRINPGITVYPRDDTHVVVIHYIAEEENQIRKYLWPLERSTEIVLQRRISRYILKDYENVIISPAVWESWSPEKQATLKDYFTQTMPDVGLAFGDRPGSPLNTNPDDSWHAKRLRLIDLFYT